MPEVGEVVAIEITEPLPETGVIDTTYKIEGAAKMLEKIGAPPWVYAQVRRKEWYKPEIAEEVSYERGFPNPLTGKFSIDFKPEKEGEYEVTVVATPAPLSLPVVGVFPITGESDIMKMDVEKVPPEEMAFSLIKPTVLPETVEPGTEITISCPVISESTKEQEIKVKCLIYEGSILPGHGTKLAEYTSAVTPIAPGETKTFDFPRRTVAGTIDRRDVEVEVYIAGQLVKESEWDDVYYVGVPPVEEIDFDLSRPSVTPTEITPGTAIAITCPVTSACTKEQTITVKCKIYEGSLLPGHGRLMATKTSSPFTISPGQGYDVTVRHTAIAGTIDRRDVEVEVYIAGRLVKENEWDDVYYVKEAPPPPPPAEKYCITTSVVPYYAGYISPDWGCWDVGYPLTIRAFHYPGYEFSHWSGDVSGTSPTITVLMYSDKNIVANFKEVPPPPPTGYRLTTSVVPNVGYVKKDPDRPLYSPGELITLTAYRYDWATDYYFDYWSGDATGTWGQVWITMDSDKSVTAHFKTL